MLPRAVGTRTRGTGPGAAAEPRAPSCPAEYSISAAAIAIFSLGFIIMGTTCALLSFPKKRDYLLRPASMFYAFAGGAGGSCPCGGAGGRGYRGTPLCRDLGMGGRPGQVRSPPGTRGGAEPGRLCISRGDLGAQGAGLVAPTEREARDPASARGGRRAGPGLSERP